MKNNLMQLGVAGLTVVLLVSLLDPFMLTMPESLVMMALLIATVLVCVFAGFVLQEQTGDEREMQQRSHAGRIAYLAGLASLMLAVIVQGLAHHVDPWIVLSLGVMLIAKLAARFYEDCRG